ncbi:hemerythrin domain-containing protein [Okeanomitos corallinicola TIOX110]|uniref:Hemerythrin domain-containing protein n=1 Tax=Okeanomitos corallinicola TIOX110 TaxID=3133117 RepID=A0ABZ2UVN4_9CYAN
MVVTLDNTKRNAIAIKLADMKLLQQLLIDNENLFLDECTDEAVADMIQAMLDDDHKNQGILDTMVIQYGIHKDAEQTVVEMVQKTRQLMQSEELSFFDKVFQHELLKHQQVMNGMTIHKAAQKVGVDVIAALSNLNTLNFENRAHQEQLKGIIEILGVRELTGQDVDQGIWARVQDAIAAISGVFGSAFTQTSENQDMSIQDFMRMDHNKINLLFTELLQSDDPEKIQEYFAQIDHDLSAHVGAEEEIVYPRVRHFYGEANTQKLSDEHTHWSLLFEELRSIDPNLPEFKERIKQIWDEIGNHFHQEETAMFTAIHNNMNSQETHELTKQFKTVKARIQQQMGGLETEVNTVNV